jgi:hypothetical protein
MMRNSRNRLVLALLVGIIVFLVSACSTASSFEDPPPDLETADLAGIWETHYSRQSTDRLELRADGTFRQTYADSGENYAFETRWNAWRLQRLSDGLIRVHLKGARYFPDTPAQQAYGLYDPFAKETLRPINELVLSVRVDLEGELVLHHMWTTSDRGFALFGGEKLYFVRIDMP